MARYRQASDSALIQCLSEVIDGRGGQGVMIGGDVARATRYQAYGGMPGLSYLPERFLPRLEAVIAASAYAAVTRQNASRWLTFTVPAS